MRYKLNLHAHCNFSDGGYTMKRMAEHYKELGFNTFVLTDHYYCSSSRPEISLNREKLDLQRRQAKNIAEELDMGFIIGIEVGVARLEEVVVIGSDAIDMIMDLREAKVSADIDEVISMEELAQVRALHPCMINLCHPGRPDRWCEAGGHKVLDGFEYIHACTLMFDRFKRTENTSVRPVPGEFTGLVKLSNSDAHSIDCLDWCWNEVEEDIRSEAELITYVQDNKPFYTISRLRDNW